MKKFTIFLPFKDEKIALHRFEVSSSPYPPVLLIHGSVENSRVFYSKSGKGLAPFLQASGFDVYVVDLRGRGASRPKVSRQSKFSQTETIVEELPFVIGQVLKISGVDSLHIGAHSWGGVLAMSCYALFHYELPVNSMIFLGTKRSISVKSLRRFLIIELGWVGFGRLVTAIYGYFPATTFGGGSDNEPGLYNRQTRKWVLGKDWVDPESGMDYKARLAQVNLPPIYFFTGGNDKVLGHPKDVRRFAEECGAAEFVKILSKANGHLHDYDHINILTHPDAVNDHFPLIAHVYTKNSH